MEGTEAIIKKIKEDADKKASSIIDNANFEGNLLKKDAEKWVEDYVKAQSEILKKQCDDIVERKKTVADLDVRKYILLKKQQLIESIIEKLYQKLCALDKESYLKFVEKNINLFCDNDDMIVLSRDNVLSKDDISSLKVVGEKKLKISEKTGDFIGGVKLVGRLSDKDLSFRSIIDDKKEEIISKVAEKLFN